MVVTFWSKIHNASHVLSTTYFGTASFIILGFAFEVMDVPVDAHTHSILQELNVNAPCICTFIRVYIMRANHSVLFGPFRIAKFSLQECKYPLEI